jgi:hypothetical protein
VWLLIVATFLSTVSTTVLVFTAVFSADSGRRKRAKAVLRIVSRKRLNPLR